MKWKRKNRNVPFFYTQKRKYTEKACLIPGIGFFYNTRFEKILPHNLPALRLFKKEEDSKPLDSVCFRIKHAIETKIVSKPFPAIVRLSE